MDEIMTLIGLGFWISVGLAVAELFGWISIGWWLVALPLLIGIGITVGIIVVVFILGVLAAAISNL
jgi:hypothetical protein